jgi:hypothetical protein
VAAWRSQPASRAVHREGVSRDDKAEAEVFWRTALGATFEQAGFGRAWSPMVEILAARELEEGQSVQWDAVPQMQVTLNQRQHLMIKRRCPHSADRPRRRTTGAGRHLLPLGLV